MTSIIKADNISTVSGSGNITIPTGVKVVGTDAGSIVAPGHVIQVVQTSQTGEFNLSHNSGSQTAWTDTGYNATITPKSSSSKILVEFDLPWFGLANTSNTSQIDATLYVGSTALDTRPIASAYVANNTYIQPHGTFLHTHGSSSAITYKIYLRGNYANAGQYSINRGDNSRVRFCLMEIAQ